MAITPRKLRSQGPAEDIDLDHPFPTKSNLLDIENELSFYGSYHSTFGNKLIHFICIPLISWSTLGLMSYLPLWRNVKIYDLFPGFSFYPSVALVVASAYQLYYIALDPIAGISFIPPAAAIYLSATNTALRPSANMPYSSYAHLTAQPLLWMVFFFGWIAQFIGHGYFERRAPALKDNLVQALVTAPFFVWLELLFALGYKPQLHKKVISNAGLRIRNFRQAAKAK
ncbi:hypothetical protein BCR39DRAFT_545034 [Naematelia encephala]|uniref:Endoplasmic reticulum protein n=1 Tax=Naematelia encephala TaxID=71784 RepID=A0A1Y2ARV3_9TREE|nr:hypothetical protein BCR39DRAFT_545034 [Naematelia encephala]